ncbi:MAG: nuclear transport factor 2 family protein [Candidatus Aminicenantes bacterium]|nr:nuclear transport factor 2 family protein [Candidatus Aminicenantes bacterium]
MNVHEPEQVLHDWIRAVNEKNEGLIEELYEPAALVMPTFSNMFLDRNDKKIGYFKTLFARNELLVTLHPRTVRVQYVGSSVAVVSGLYCWSMTVEEEPVSYEARFSFVLDLSQPRPILHHHSSQIPRTIYCGPSAGVDPGAGK